MSDLEDELARRNQKRLGSDESQKRRKIVADFLNGVIGLGEAIKRLKADGMTEKQARERLDYGDYAGQE